MEGMNMSWLVVVRVNEELETPLPMDGWHIFLQQ